ncbi:allantoate deiminase [Enterococcus hulanensis]|uniref:Allantoate deiminase n=1 Tax=Enterococcus hulanensis TaxID=2559929 RepID=A0ABU3ETH8_9ENTE|nr:allantoate deiminase [Enterococcus hulanensis]MDT2598165.1 allantoate deiminase [Enterococcus hulanensis]MDT2608330.1 allantoate deiminase [Enterococcus hulanensis]MDT2615625.1 allantoate deiminase [Enterococcus hulanensis]MDT2626404.1 allantoate deiminase [Enterococcus hulanensis]MDT2654697.1 allantoate deiminase [Enterococcus hulanensis]
MTLEKRLDNNIKALSQIGSDPTGGMTRLLYSDSWLEAQKFVEGTMQEIGLETSYDEIGNLFGRVTGTKYPEETILSGSHIDTVVNGGTLDGQFGVMAAYLAIQQLLETYGKPLRSLEVISMAEEEGSRFPTVFWGSKNFVCEASREQVEDIADSEGLKFVDEMRRQGFDFAKEAKTRRDDIKAFVEIHIEQGNVLENEKLQIGVVNNIAGQKRYTFVLRGEANHAGTTPMGYRRDAVYGFSKICSGIIDRAFAEGDPLVVTFGKVETKPNTVNVVPGEVLFTMDCRHTDANELNRFTKEAEAYMKEVASELGLTLEIDLWMDETPVPMDESVVEVVENAAKTKEMKYKLMHSGAGHDSQVIAPHYPTAMIFVPSIKGISHNPAEATDLADLVAGVEVLTQALYELAYKE